MRAEYLALAGKIFRMQPREALSLAYGELLDMVACLARARTEGEED